MRRSLPTLEGVVELPGLGSSVEVLRDRFGVPQIFASCEEDLFFTQGFVHAQDRFFQMELGRRAGHGRLSELLGESALGFDRLSRTVGFGRIATSSTKDAPREVLRALESYSAGVNACLTTEPRPPELSLLRVSHPEPWTPDDTAAWSVVMAWSLSASWESKLSHRAAEEELGGRDDFRAYLDPSTGSNAWAVAPGRSATGSALLAGDPHLVLGIPCLWYEVGLYGGPYRVVGASLPGSPGVVIGHNEEIAWSVTAALTDVQDLYVERFAEVDDALYEQAGTWREAEVREEEIPVRGRRQPVAQKVRTTLHGPIISDVVGGEDDLALRWAAPEPLKLVEAGLAIGRARNKEEFLGALRDWTAPNQNFVYADRTGAIGRVLAGPAPVRNNHRGDRVVPGWSGEYEWEGFLSFQEMPKNLDPDEGYVASENEPPEPSPGTYPIPGNYGPGYRKERIEALLRTTDRHTLESFRAIQGDLYSSPAHALAGKLARLDPPPEVPEWLLRELAVWEGHLVAESRPGAVARVALEVLLRRAAGPTMLRDVSPVTTGIENYLTRLIPELVKKLDDLPEEVLRSALEEAVEILRGSYSLDPSGWSWGALHAAELRHPLGVVRALSDLLNRGPYPAGGDANTIRHAGFPSGTPGRPSFGPVTTGANYRFVVDTGDWEQAWSVIAPGQSGHPASANYDDQIELWQNVRYRPMVFGRETAELAARHRLILNPSI